MNNVNVVLNHIYKKSQLQRKKIDAFISSRGEPFINEFEEFLNLYIEYLEKNNLTIEYGVDAYLKMVNDMVKSQLKFMRTGMYPVSKVIDAVDNVYNNKTEMLSYMIGLALSQYLWSTHYDIFNHFKSAIKQNKNNINSYLEVGPGHGLFLKNTIDELKNGVEITAIDISPISLDVSRSIITHFYPEKEIQFINEDMLNIDLDNRYDFIVMGEVIEHVESPERLLLKIKKLLSDNGKSFISTCVNCPAIDHVYHFHTVDQIREMLNNCGLNIESENVLPVEDISMLEVIDKKVTINYSAIVKVD